MRRRLAIPAALVMAVTLAPAALAVQPDMETVELDEHFTDTRMCAGFDVAVDLGGHIRIARYYDKTGDLVMEVNNIALKPSYSANGKTVQLVDAGVDKLTVFDDGSATLAVVGNVQLVTAPGEGVVGGETGRLLLFLSASGDVTVLSEHGKRAGDRNAAICELLAS